MKSKVCSEEQTGSQNRTAAENLRQAVVMLVTSLHHSPECEAQATRLGGFISNLIAPRADWTGESPVAT
jgi:hypothetical protein